MGGRTEPTGGEAQGGPPPVFRLNRRGSSSRIVSALIPIFKGGGIALLPTDTIYGFSGRFDSPASWKRIREIKGSERSIPMLSLISGPEMAFQYAEPPHGASYEILIKYWPGPLTAVLRARPHVPTEFCGPGDTISFRWPLSPFLQSLIDALGVPLLSTSANRSGDPPLNSFAAIQKSFGTLLDALVDGGELRNQASTVVDLTGSDPLILRQGTLRIPGELEAGPPA